MFGDPKESIRARLMDAILNDTLFFDIISDVPLHILQDPTFTGLSRAAIFGSERVLLHLLKFCDPLLNDSNALLRACLGKNQRHVEILAPMSDADKVFSWFMAGGGSEYADLLSGHVSRETLEDAFRKRPSDLAGMPMASRITHHYRLMSVTESSLPPPSPRSRL